MKKWWKILLIVCIMCTVTGCGTPREKTEDEIREDIQNFSEFGEGHDVTINSIEIMQRETDVETKKDEIVVNITADNDAIELTTSYEVKYYLNEDSDWVLQYVRRNSLEETEIQPKNPPGDELLAEYAPEGYTLEQLMETTDSKHYAAIYKKTNTYTMMDIFFQYEIKYYFDESKEQWIMWEKNKSEDIVWNEDAVNGHWKATFAPSAWYETDEVETIHELLVTEATQEGYYVQVYVNGEFLYEDDKEYDNYKLFYWDLYYWTMLKSADIYVTEDGFVAISNVGDTIHFEKIDDVNPSEN